MRQRGSLTVWFTAEAIEGWRAAPRTTPGGQPNSSDLAITVAMMLRAVFHLALRQTEGLIGSILHLVGLALPVPDHSAIGRRARTMKLATRPRASRGPLHRLVDSTGRLLILRDQARRDGDAPSQAPAAAIQVLTATLDQPADCFTSRRGFLRGVAQMGGFLARTADGDPG